MEGDLGCCVVGGVSQRPFWTGLRGRGGGVCISDTCWEKPAREEEAPGLSWRGDVNHAHRLAQACLVEVRCSLLTLQLALWPQFPHL